jgi:RNA polymerase sigma-70 factor (ECF subfamily)
MSVPTPPTTDDTSSSLLSRVKNQDADAFLQLVHWIGPFILRWCLRAGLQSADRDEVSQLVLIKLWRGLANFRKDRPDDSFRGWVFTITRNCICDWFARNKDTPHALPAAVLARTEPSDEQDLKRRAVHLIIRELITRHVGDRGFQAFRRTVVDGLSAVMVAEELGMSPDVVRQHKSRWIKRLRDQLRDQFGEMLE